VHQKTKVSRIAPNRNLPKVIYHSYNNPILTLDIGSFMDLLANVESGGCSAKIPPQKLQEIVQSLKIGTHPQLLVGSDTCDDAAVWKVDAQTAVIQTTDFFPPVCSDPFEFGQIAATNALSDIYSMGGMPSFALNLVMFPSLKMDISILQEILKGGQSKLEEAGVILAGGHSIDDETIKYGLVVTGFAPPNEIVTNSAAQIGDDLILTKPIGSGIILAAHKLGQIESPLYRKCLESLKVLNKRPMEAMKKFGIKAATDITGFGLMGHAMEMAKGSNVSLKIDIQKIPLFEGTYELAEKGCLPCALFKNYDFSSPDVFFTEGIDYSRKMIMFDAQTSGGVLLSVPKEKSSEVREFLGDNAHLIGEVIAPTEKRIILQ